MQSTIDQLHTMKLSGMLDAWREQQTMPTYHDLSFDERFTLIVEREYLRRQNQRLQRRLRLSHLPVHATLDAIDFEVPRGLRKLSFLDLAQGRWLTEHLGLVLMGPTGVGKSFLACALAEHLCRQGHSVRYFKLADLLLAFKFALGDGSYPKLRKQLVSYDLLVLDEWLRDPLPVHEAREVLDILDERYRKASCLFASQIPVEQWHPQIQDPTLADAILDRIVHDSIKLSLKGESMRKLTSKLAPAQPQDVPKEEKKAAKDKEHQE